MGRLGESRRKDKQGKGQAFWLLRFSEAASTLHPRHPLVDPRQGTWCASRALSPCLRRFWLRRCECPVGMAKSVSSWHVVFLARLVGGM